jgi:ketosteroid isomerase-like protein
MSQESVEVVRRGLEAWVVGDAEGMAALCDEDMEFAGLMSQALGEGSYRGKDAWATYFGRLRETWQEWRFEDLEVLEAKDGQAVAVCSLVARGKESGALVRHRIGMTVSFRDGKLWRMHTYPDPSEALEAAGLSA